MRLIFDFNWIIKTKKYIFSSDRVRHQTSTEELRPFVFRDPDDQVILGQTRRKRNPSPFFTLFDKPPVQISRKDRRVSFVFDPNRAKSFFLGKFPQW